MGWHAARKLRRGVAGLRRVLAVEVLAASRALRLRDLPPGPAAQAVIDVLGDLGAPGPDAFLAPDLAQVEALLEQGALADVVAGVSP